MNGTRISRGLRLSIMAAALCFTAFTFAADELPTVTVTAEVMTKTLVGRTSSGVPIEEVTLSHHVSYANINIATHEGAMALKRRVEEAARLGCRQLARLYPHAEESDQTCVRKAVAEASPQVDEAITNAEKKARGH